MPEVSTYKNKKTVKIIDGEHNGEKHGTILSETLKLNGGIFIKNIRKRDSSLQPFDIEKIVIAAHKAMIATGEGSQDDARRVAENVYKELLKMAVTQKDFIPNVEGVQDLVEKYLILARFPQTAKAYILYRKEHADLRAEGLSVPSEIKEKYKESKIYFKNPLAELVYYRSYSRWIEREGRRETWVETIQRFVDFMRKRLKNSLKESEYKEIHEAILSQEIIPSMRLLWSAGEAVEKTNVAAYNCSYIAPTHWQDFGEMFYIQMCGAGIGFSVESQTVQQLPLIKRQTRKILKTFVIPDSKEGWANALVLGLKTWAGGNDIDFDYSKIRPSGARLKTMGGRASGPEPLRELLEFVKRKILHRQGRRLTNLDVHDLICKTGEVVVAGGVRRSSLISLSDLDDNEMRYAKTGQFYLTEPQRSMANNSAVYNERPTNSEFIDEWVALLKSGTGERGIFNRGSLEKQLPERRWKVFKNYVDTAGTNPCGEIILRSKQFCNLTSIVIRADDTRSFLIRKTRLATIIGTFQATLTDFPYLSKEWKKNCQEEALLGVSLTGYWDNKIVRNAKILLALKNEAIKVNQKYAKRFKINTSTCITCVKPSGNSSQLLDTASGMHPRFAKYYIRRVRINATDPLLKTLRDQGIPAYPEVGQTPDMATTFVLEFPVASPAGAVVKNDIPALEFLEHWKLLKQNFTEHNPSATVYVGDDEWIAVANWVYNNWEIVGGLSFLPRNNNAYQLAPYEEIDKETYQKLAKVYENLDFSKVYLYEKEDETDGAKEFACVAGSCEI